MTVRMLTRRGENTSTKDHELSGLDRSDANKDKQAPVVDVGLSHRITVTTNEIRFLRDLSSSAPAFH